MKRDLVGNITIEEYVRYIVQAASPIRAVQFEHGCTD